MELARNAEEPWFLKSSHSVLFPSHEALKKPQGDFDEFIRLDLARRYEGPVTELVAPVADKAMTDATAESETFTLVSKSTSAEIRKGMEAMDVGVAETPQPEAKTREEAKTSNPFMEGLLKHGKGPEKEGPPRTMENMMLTENSGLAYRSTTDALVDLFSELEDVVSGPRLRELLEAAWKADPLATLKIIFNARSIHLGKSSRTTFYRCAGWLAQNHPYTLVANLRWLSRPVIEKKASKEGEDDVVIVDVKDDDDPAKFDVRNGVAHGYWKDLLNILALAVNNKLDPLADPRDVLNSENPGILRGKSIRKLRARGGSAPRSRGRGGSFRGRGGISRGGGMVSRGRRIPSNPPWRRGMGRGAVRGRGGIRGRGRGLGRGYPSILHSPPFPPGPFPPGPPPPCFPPGFPSNFLSWQANAQEEPSPPLAPPKMKFATPGAFDSLVDLDTDSSEGEENTEASRREEGTDALQDDEETEPPKKKKLSYKEAKRETRQKRHDAAIKAFDTNPVYRALHLTIARLFAEQLEADSAALRGSDPKAKRAISLCGKWAPSHEHFHDKHTFIISTIAEILYPRDGFDEALQPTDGREKYLRYAREQYRKDTSALRKHLEIVERNLTEKTYGDIKYDRIPSLAMKNYSHLFIERDMERFEKYIDQVAQGKAKISGATLLPSTLIQTLTQGRESYDLTDGQKAGMSATKLMELKVQQMEHQVVDGQWKTLVQRIKDSGTLESSIAVCDVSGSMFSPVFHDKTRPLDSAIGLSLLIAEVAKPPFGGAFITFSASPRVQRIDLSKSIKEKYEQVARSPWGMNTDFVAVFDRLILPMAIENKLNQEDMVKRVFIFSDMQFDKAGTSHGFGYHSGRRDENQWHTSYGWIKKKYEDAGYEMPELVFWNLAGGRAGHSGSSGDPTAPKPVVATDEGTSLVSGYSQGMLKVFLDNGSFEEPEEESEDEVVVTKDGDDNVTAEAPKKRAKMDPLRTVRKAISHGAYDMLKVVD